MLKVRILIMLFILPSLLLSKEELREKKDIKITKEIKKETKKTVVNKTVKKDDIISKIKEKRKEKQKVEDCSKNPKCLKIEQLKKEQLAKTKDLKEKEASDPNTHTEKTDKDKNSEKLEQYESITELLVDIFSELDFKDSQFSFTLLDEKGKSKASVNKDLKLNQASVSKLIVSLAALKYLGLNYRFKTNFYIDGEIDKDGVLDGNLIIKGYGDPNLLTEDIYKIIDFLKLIGLKEIKKNIILD